MLEVRRVWEVDSQDDGKQGQRILQAGGREDAGDIDIKVTTTSRGECSKLHEVGFVILS